MAFENLETTYTEVDDTNELVLNGNVAQATNIDNSNNYVVWRDAGADHFGSTFTHDFQMALSTNAAAYVRFSGWSLTNDVGDTQEWYTDGDKAITALARYRSSTGSYLGLIVYGNVGSTYDSDTYTGFTYSQTYNCTATRSGTDDVTLAIYDNATPRNLLDTLTVTVQSGQKYRFVQAFSGNNDGGTQVFTCAAGNLDLNEVVAFAGSGALAATAATVTGSGTATVPAFAGVGTLVAAETTLTGSGTITVPSVSGSGALATTATTLAGSGTATVPDVAGEGALVSDAAALAGSGATAPPAFAGEGATASAEAILAGSGLVTAPALSGSGTPATSAATLAGSGLVTVPEFSGAGALEAAETTLTGDGAIGGLSYTGLGDLVVAAAIVTSVNYRANAPWLIGPGETYVAGGTESAVHIAGGVGQTHVAGGTGGIVV